MIYSTKTPTELARTLRRVAWEQKAYRAETIAELKQAADLLDHMPDTIEDLQLAADLLAKSRQTKLENRSGE